MADSNKRPKEKDTIKSSHRRYHKGTLAAVWRCFAASIMFSSHHSVNISLVSHATVPWLRCQFSFRLPFYTICPMITILSFVCSFWQQCYRTHRFHLQSVCMSVSIYVCFYGCQYICLCMCLSIYLMYVSVSVFMSIFISAGLSERLHIYPHQRWKWETVQETEGCEATY